MNFAQKLKSFKRWAWLFSTLLPVVTEALTKQIGWPEAISYSLMACLVGLGVIGAEDIVRIRAGASKALPTPPRD